MLPKVMPNLWFNGNGAEATEFYVSLFPGSAITNTVNYPNEGLLDFQKDMAGKPLAIDFRLRDLDFSAINAGPEFKGNPSTSFMVNFDPASEDRAREHLDELWEKLSDGGKELMPLGEYPFSKHYGWVEDRYGFSWQLILTDPDGDPRPTIIPCLLFGGPNQNRAQEALDFYAAELPEVEVGNVMHYEQQTGPATPGSVMFAEFKLGGQWFAAMDSGVEQDFTFTEAVSFAVNCADQAEIDALWAKLSSVPEAEQCGWCKDPLGVSWQIVPQNMAELMARPDAYEHMMQMKKLVIADF
jgi:predicted 3-demethylubiquinone-9 3-methyltransferase (glyoxalase superfamily)